MTGVFYYANNDLILQVKYSHETDTLLYSSHRRISDREQKVIESHIPANVAVESRSATFYYLGINHKLTQIFGLLSFIRPFESDVTISDKAIEHLISANKELISQSDCPN